MSPGRLPADPAAFVAAAERITNAYDAEACVGVYAEGALFEALTDGTLESFRGRAAIGRAWRVYTTVLRRAGFSVEKRLTVAADGVLVNEWEGSLSGGLHARGFERWVFDDERLVREHALYSYLDVRASTDPVQRLRLLASHPRLALSFLREQRRARLSSTRR